MARNPGPAYSGISGRNGPESALRHSGFNGLYERKQDPPLEAACWAHVRRKFYDIYQATSSPPAREALDKIGELHGIEAEIVYLTRRSSSM